MPKHKQEELENQKQGGDRLRNVLRRKNSSQFFPQGAPKEMDSASYPQAYSQFPNLPAPHIYPGTFETPMAGRTTQGPNPHYGAQIPPSQISAAGLGAFAWHTPEYGQSTDQILLHEPGRLPSLVQPQYSGHTQTLPLWSPKVNDELGDASQQDTNPFPNACSPYENPSQTVPPFAYPSVGPTVYPPTYSHVNSTGPGSIYSNASFSAFTFPNEPFERADLAHSGPAGTLPRLQSNTPSARFGKIAPHPEEPPVGHKEASAKLCGVRGHNQTLRLLQLVEKYQKSGRGQWSKVTRDWNEEFNGQAAVGTIKHYYEKIAPKYRSSGNFKAAVELGEPTSAYKMSRGRTKDTIAAEKLRRDQVDIEILKHFDSSARDRTNEQSAARVRSTPAFHQHYKDQDPSTEGLANRNRVLRARGIDVAKLQADIDKLTKELLTGSQTDNIKEKVEEDDESEDRDQMKDPKIDNDKDCGEGQSAEMVAPF